LTDSQDAAVWARGLVKVWGENRAVDGVDLTVPAGTIYGVLGPNGAGKTTTIRMLATLLRPDAGEAKIFGRDVRREAHVVRQLIGVTGQYASVDDRLTGRENLVIFGRLLGLSGAAARQRADLLLDMFDLGDAAKRPVKRFSGGMRRRLDLAASLIAQPPLIFLDEPTTGLDPRTRAQMWETIRDLVRTGSTVLLTTQYLEEADALADRVAVVDRGHVVAEGTVDTLKASIGTTTLNVTLTDPRDFAAAQRIVHATLGLGSIDEPATTGRRIIAPLTEADRTADVLMALRAANITIAELTVQKPTLDEVFLTITGHAAEPHQPARRLWANEREN
jgi:ABC-2 type transport system ATP-binding protein